MKKKTLKIELYEENGLRVTVTDDGNMAAFGVSPHRSFADVRELVSILQETVEDWFTLRGGDWVERVCYHTSPDDYYPCGRPTTLICEECKNPACARHARTVEDLDGTPKRMCLSCIEEMNTCVVANQFCETQTQATCFACGQRACTNCSCRVRYYNYGIRRVCHNCLEEYDGNYRRVFKHLEKQAREHPAFQ